MHAETREQRTVPDLLATGLERNPTSICLTEGTRQATFVQLHRRANQAAELLVNKGVQHGDRVSLLAKNEFEFAELQIATQRIGAVFVPLNYRLTVEELQYIVTDCAPKILFAGPDHEADASKLGVDVICLGPAYEDAIAEPASALDALPRMLCGTDVAQILYTSGTTGRPKGAVVTNDALYSRMLTYACELQVGSNETIVQCLPLFHLAGTFSLAYLMMGAHSVVIRKVDAADIIDAISDNRATVIHLVPTILSMLLEVLDESTAKEMTLKKVLYGGSPIPPPTLMRARKVLSCDLINLYGLTEAGAATILSLPKDANEIDHPAKLTGYDMIGFQTAIFKEDGSPATAGEVGEICIRGRGVMSGYWQNEKETQATIRENWVRTGDGGFKTKDGGLYLSDRLKDMIISGGENIFSVEVENALSECHQVAEAAVIGVPDDRLGERVHAAIVLAPGIQFDRLEAERFLRQRIAGYKIPRSWSIETALPRNSMGKVVKSTVRAKIRASQSI